MEKVRGPGVNSPQQKERLYLFYPFLIFASFAVKGLRGDNGDGHDFWGVGFAEEQLRCRRPWPEHWMSSWDVTCSSEKKDLAAALAACSMTLVAFSPTCESGKSWKCSGNKGKTLPLPKPDVRTANPSHSYGDVQVCQLGQIRTRSFRKLARQQNQWSRLPADIHQKQGHESSNIGCHKRTISSTSCLGWHRRTEK